MQRVSYSLSRGLMTPAAGCLLGTLENKDHVITRTPLLSTATPTRPWSSSHSNLKPRVNGCTGSSPSWFPEGDSTNSSRCVLVPGLLIALHQAPPYPS